MTDTNGWRDILPPGLDAETLAMGTPVLDRRGRETHVVGVSVSHTGAVAIVLADNGMLWDASADELRYNLDEKLGMGAALSALGPVDCDVEWWHELLFRWAADDVDDDDRIHIARALLADREAATLRAYENATPEQRAAIDASWERVPEDLFAGATLPADWHERVNAGDADA